MSYIHRWQPAERERPVTLLLLHGTGGDENDLVPLAQKVAPGAALLGVRGNVLENGAPRFFRRLAEGVFDLDDLHRRTGELATFLSEAIARYEIDASRFYALGFSNGANIAASLLLTRPEALAGAILLRAMVPFEPPHPSALHGRSCLISQGRADPIVPASHGERLAELLRAGGADVTLAWQQASHQIVKGDILAMGEWIEGKSVNGEW